MADDSSVLRAILAAFKIEVDHKELEDATKKVDGFVDKLKVAGRAIGEALLVNEFREFFQTGIEQAAHLQDLSDRLDVSTSAIRGFGNAARSAGVDMESAVHALSLLQRQVGAASLGGAKQAEIFRTLGIQIKDAGGKTRSMQDIVLDVADAFQKMPDQATRAAYAMELFGRQGRLLLPVLSKGRESIQEFFSEAGAIGEDFPRKAKEVREGFERLSIATGLLKDQAVAAAIEAIGPALLAVVGALTSGVHAVIEFNKHSGALKYLLEAIGVALGLRLVNTVRSLASTFGFGMSRMVAQLREFQTETAKATAGVEAMRVESGKLGTPPIAGGAGTSQAAKGTGGGGGGIEGTILAVGISKTIDDFFGTDGPLLTKIGQYVQDVSWAINPAAAAAQAITPKNEEEVNRQNGFLESLVGSISGLADVFKKAPDVRYAAHSDSAIPTSPASQGFKTADPKGFASLISLETLKYTDKKLYDIRKGLTQDTTGQFAYQSYHERGEQKQLAHVQQNIRFGDINVETGGGSDPDDVGGAVRNALRNGSKQLENANTLNAEVVP